MPAGARDQVIKFQSSALADDGAGGGGVTWSDIANGTTRAAIAPMSGRELVAAQQVQARALYRVTIPNRRDLTEKMRIKWVSNGDKILNIRDLGDAGKQPIEATILAELAPDVGA